MTKWNYNYCPPLLCPVYSMCFLELLTKGAPPTRAGRTPCWRLFGTQWVDSASWVTGINSNLTPLSDKMQLFCFWQYSWSVLSVLTWKEIHSFPTFSLNDSWVLLKENGVVVLLNFHFFKLWIKVFGFYNKLSCHPFLRWMPTVKWFWNYVNDYVT